MDRQQPPSPTVNPPENQPPPLPPPPPPPPQKCPRCDSPNTKFCYYNNYSLSQPRYFCKACRRYWTHGGTLRNVPVGGGRRRSTKRSKIAGNRGVSPAHRSQNLMAGQPSRPSLAVVPPAGGSVFAGNVFSGMQYLPGGGINQRAAAASFGGGSSQLGANMSMLQGINLQSLKPPVAAAHPFQPPTNMFPLNQSLIPPRNWSFWNQSLINTSASSYSAAAATSSFWSGNAAGDRAPSSSSRNQSCDNYRGFNTYNPSQ